MTAYLAVWYLGNIYYNIYNKKACIALGKNAAGASNAHWALSAVQVKAIVELYVKDRMNLKKKHAVIQADDNSTLQRSTL